MRLLLLSVLVVTTAASCVRMPLVSPDDRAVRVVLSRYLRAVGGNAAWDTVRTRVTHGRAELAPPGATAQFTLVEAPERRLFTLQLPNGARQREGFDDRGGWVQSPRGEVRDEPAGLSASASRERKLARDPRLGGYRSFTLLPRADHFHARLTARTVDGVIDTLHFEHSSGLLVRRDIEMATLQGRVRVQIHYEDYRRVGGMRVPFRIRQVRPDRTFTMQVDSVQFNVPLAASAFERPQGAQPESFGDGAPYGPHRVGFTVMHLRDRTRPWEASGDSAALIGRPVRVSVWYPATPSPVGRPMAYGDYVNLPSLAVGDSLLATRLRERNDRNLHEMFANLPADLPRLLNIGTRATADATPVQELFPLVVYSQGLNSGLQHDNTVLAEVVASHGFVVAQVPQVGRAADNLELSLDPSDLETQVRDLEVAIASVAPLAYADATRIAMLGWSMGGVAGLLVAGRNEHVRAVVGPDATFRAGWYTNRLLGSPWFDPSRQRVPILALQSGNAQFIGGQSDAVMDSLRFAPRYLGRVGNIAHGDFSDFPVIASRFPVTIEHRTAAEALRGHRAVAEVVVLFLRAALRDDAEAMERLAHGPLPSGVSLRFMPSK